MGNQRNAEMHQLSRQQCQQQKSAQAPAAPAIERGREKRCERTVLAFKGKLMILDFQLVAELCALR